MAFLLDNSYTVYLVGGIQSYCVGFCEVLILRFEARVRYIHVEIHLSHLWKRCENV